MHSCTGNWVASRRAVCMSELSMYFVQELNVGTVFCF